MAKCTCKKGVAKKCSDCKPKKTGMRAVSRKLKPKQKIGLGATKRKLKRKPNSTGMRAISKPIKPQMRRAKKKKY